jgi:putative NADPH-quinone reductase
MSLAGKVAKLEFTLRRGQKDHAPGTVHTSLKPVQDELLWAEHLVVFFPLWVDIMPALPNGFFEQPIRLSFTGGSISFFDKKLLSDRSVRFAVKKGRPAAIYRWYFRAHSLKSLERYLLGIATVSRGCWHRGAERVPNHH